MELSCEIVRVSLKGLPWVALSTQLLSASDQLYIVTSHFLPARIRSKSLDKNICLFLLHPAFSFPLQTFHSRWAAPNSSAAQVQKQLTPLPTRKTLEADVTSAYELKKRARGITPHSSFKDIFSPVCLAVQHLSIVSATFPRAARSMRQRPNNESPKLVRSNREI